MDIYFTRIGDKCGYIARIKGMRYQVCGIGNTEQEAAEHLMKQFNKCKELLSILNRRQ